MIEYIKFRSKLKEIEAKILQNENVFRSRIDKVEDRDGDEAERIHDEYNTEKSYLERKIDELQSSRYQAKALKHDIPLPDRSDARMWNKDFWGQRLTARGRFEVRRAIRQEIRESFDPYIQIISLIIGFIGIVIAFISILN